MYVLITMMHHFSNIFLVELWYEPCLVQFDKYSLFDFTALCSDVSAVSVLQLDLKIVTQTHYITFQDINLQPYLKVACVKSVWWPALISNGVNVSLSGGILGYWTACNNFKRYCTLPYYVIGSQIPLIVHIPIHTILYIIDFQYRWIALPGMAYNPATTKVEDSPYLTFAG